MLARFANNAGLEQRAKTCPPPASTLDWRSSALPNRAGNGRIIAGYRSRRSPHRQQPGRLILASTQYRGNARVIDAMQLLFDELLNLRTQIALTRL